MRKNKISPSLSFALVKMSVSLHNYGLYIPKERKLIKDFIKEQSEKCAVLPAEEVYYWAQDMDLFIGSIVTSKLVSDTALATSKEEKEIIRMLNGQRRGIRHDLLALKRMGYPRKSIIL